jgi:putative DNA primase/helicase
MHQEYIMMLREDLMQQWQERKEAIRARFDITSYAQQHFGGTLKCVNTQRSEYRLTGMGHGGFVINEADKTWYIHDSGIGGDVFALVAYVLYGDTDTGSHRFRDIMQAAADYTGVDLPEYQRQKPPQPPQATKQQPDTYIYTDEAGQPVHRTQRYYVQGEKRFAQEYYDPASQTWQKQAAPEQRYVLYHLPEVQKARQETSTIFLVEGEKDADALRAAGVYATCMAMGAGKWRNEYASQLEGAHVAIIPDNDKPGVAGAFKIADKLQPVCASVKIVYLPDVTKRGQDVSDWLAMPTASIPALQRLVKATEEHRIPAAPAASTSTSQRQRQRAAMTDEAYHGTDTAMGMRLVHMHGDHVRWLQRSKIWLFWNGKYWQEDTTGVLQRMTVSVIRDLADEAQNEPNTDRRNALRKIAIRAESMARRNAMIEAAKSEDGIAMSENEFDPAKHLYNVQNGIVDLRTGQLHQHAPGYYQTNIVDIDYKPGSPCARWLQFLEEVFDSDQSLINYMQEVMGYMLTGEIKQEQFWFFYGTGKNGKSTLLQTLTSIAGSYATTIPVSTIMSNDRATVPYELADMAGKRIVITSELPRAKRMSTEVVKSITSKDRINAQRKYGQPFVFDPSHKLIMAGNDKPIIKDPTDGIWRRLALVLFGESFEGREDHQLEEKLMSEREGIMAWAIEGAQRWYARMHLQEPRSVTRARAEYRSEEDDLADFLHEHCISAPGIATPHGKLYDQYKVWAAENGYSTLTTNRFGRELEARGFKAADGTGGKRMRLNIGLRAREDEDTSESSESSESASVAQQRYGNSESNEHEHTNGHAPALTSEEQSAIADHVDREGALAVVTDGQAWYLVDDHDMPIIARTFVSSEAAWLALAGAGIELQHE